MVSALAMRTKYKQLHSNGAGANPSSNQRPIQGKIYQNTPPQISPINTNGTVHAYKHAIYNEQTIYDFMWFLVIW